MKREIRRRWGERENGSRGNASSNLAAAAVSGSRQQQQPVAAVSAAAVCSHQKSRCKALMTKRPAVRGLSPVACQVRTKINQPNRGEGLSARLVRH